ncbi:hypothetical protein [Methylicorpusculum sp.]|nr:hypothetical protein [Methylicorpusculum sp.]MDP3529937.1 hypothetical protein [Methylicorpusculum sp.]MDZ4150974.1 hypothetical protein [Methylicorpusculum sp.]
MLWSTAGLEIPLTKAVEIDLSRAYAQINRRNGRRNIQVKLGVTPGRVAEPAKI